MYNYFLNTIKKIKDIQSSPEFFPTLSASVGFGILQAWIFIFLGSFKIIAPVGVDVSNGYSPVIWLFVCPAISALFIYLAFKKKKRIGMPPKLVLNFLLAFFIIIAACGSYYFLLSSSPAQLTGAGSLFFSLTTGICFTVLLAIWSILLSSLQPVSIAFTIAIGNILGITAALGPVNSIPVKYQAALLLVCVIGEALTLLYASHGVLTFFKTSDIYYARDAQLAFPFASTAVLLIASGLIIGILGFTFFTSVGIASNTNNLLVACGTAAIFVIGCMIASIAIAANKFNNWDFLLRMSTPFVGGTALLLPLIEKGSSTIVSSIFIAAFVLFITITWSYSYKVTQSYTIHPLRIFSFFSCTLSLGIALSLFLVTPAISPIAVSIPYKTSATTVIMFLLIVRYAFLPNDPSTQANTAKTDGTNDKTSDDPVTEPTSTFASTPCAKGAQSYIKSNFMLTKRESEIALYLAKGYNCSKICDRLYISEGTMKTHSYHIYRKMNIHSQQELIALFEEAEKTIYCPNNQP